MKMLEIATTNTLTKMYKTLAFKKRKKNNEFSFQKGGKDMFFHYVT